MAKKTRYSDKELDAFQRIIEAKLRQSRIILEEYLQQISDHGDSEDARIRGLDDAGSTSQNDRLSNMAARQRKYIHHLENALLRVKNKNYGICRASGELISKKRLKVVPHATLSIKAKQQR